MKDMILVERKSGVSIWGKRIDAKGRLGNFEVVSDMLGNNGNVYALLTDAQHRMNALIGVQNR